MAEDDISATETLRRRGFSRRSAIIGGVLACASGVAYARQPQVANVRIPQDIFEKWVPDALGPWHILSSSGVLLPPPDALRDRLYDNLVTRVYGAPNMPPILVLLAYNNTQDGVVQVHRPEVCYSVGDFQLSETTPITINIGTESIPAKFFTATGPNRIEQVEYFTRMGKAFPRSWAQQRLAVMRANIEGIIPDGMMMRVSVLGMNAAQARPILAVFIESMIRKSNPSLQRLLLGSSL